MCNSNADDGANYLEPKPKPLEIGTKCRKCQDHRAQVVLQIKDAYCRDCFLAYCSHKFRGLMGRTRVLHGGKERPVLLAFSGSSSSLALLHLVQDATAVELGHRRLTAKPSVLYIDEGAVLGLDVDVREQQCLDILEQLQGMPAFVVSLSLGDVTPRNLTQTEPNVETSGDDQVAALFAALSDLSSKLDMLTRIRSRVIAAVARKLGIDSVMLGDNATSLACAILVTMSLGRGAHVPVETGFLDERESGVRFIRPLKELSSKEVAFFTRFRGLEPTFIPSLLTKSNIDASIHRLTEDFVVSLQSQFPSTVPTISRTGDKLHVVSGEESCALCLAPLDTDPRDCSAMDATEFSRSLSTPPATTSSNSSCQCSSQCGCSDKQVMEPNCNCGSSSKANDVLNKKDVLQSLCYACRILAASLKSVEQLPANTLTVIQERISFRQMKSQIQEFLLE